MPAKLKRKLIMIAWGLGLILMAAPLFAFGEKPIDLAPKFQHGVVITHQQLKTQSLEQIFGLAQQEPFLFPSSIKRFYLQVTGNLMIAEVENFVAAAHDQKFEVYLYLAKPQYALEHGEPTITWDSLLDYQLKLPVEKRFDGAFLDIHPYELKNYTENQRQIMNKYISLLKTLKSQKILSRVNIPMMITVHPHWIYENADTTPPYLYELMNYVNEIGVDTRSFEVEPLLPALTDIGRYLKKLNSKWYLISQNNLWTTQKLFKPSSYFAYQFNKTAGLQDLGYLGVIFTETLSLNEFQNNPNTPETQVRPIERVNQIIEGSDKDWDFDDGTSYQVMISSSNIRMQMSQNDKYLYFAIKSEIPLKTFYLYFSPQNIDTTQMKQAVTIAEINLTEDRPRGTWVQDLNFQKPFSIISHVIKEKNTPFIEIAIPKDSLILDNAFYCGWGLTYEDGTYFNESFESSSLNYHSLCTL